MNWDAMDDFVERMKRELQVPEEEIKDVQIFCNDCHKNCTVKDYLIGVYKCTECGSYNTQR